MRAVVGQQVSVAGARTVAGRWWPEPAPRWPRVRSGDPSLPDAPRPVGGRRRREAMPGGPRRRACAPSPRRWPRVAVGSTPAPIPPNVSRRLQTIPGVGPWTIAYVSLRALADPDAFLPTDLGVRRALSAGRPRGDPTSLLALAERWRPWRAYAMVHLWAGPTDTPRARPAATRAPTSQPPQEEKGRSMKLDVDAPPTVRGTAVGHRLVVESPIGPLALEGNDRTITHLFLPDTGPAGGVSSPGRRRPSSSGRRRSSTSTSAPVVRSTCPLTSVALRSRSPSGGP